MQFGADLFTYERLKKKKLEYKEDRITLKSMLRIAFIIIASLLISRVCFINSTAPFGIALVIAGRSFNKGRENILIFLGTVIGYITLASKIKNFWVYIIIVSLITLYPYILNDMKKIKQLICSFSTVFIFLFIYKGFISDISLLFSTFSSVIEVFSILPIYYIIESSFLSFDKLKTKHVFTNDEIISMAITLSLIIGGAYGFNIYGASITNIIAIFIVVLIGNINGSGIGAATGVVIGAITGISTSNMFVFISIYSFCGLVAGMLREAGRYISGAVTLITFIALLIYSDNINVFRYIEALIGITTIGIIPQKIYKWLEGEFNIYIKQDNINEGYAIKIKEVFSEKLGSFSEVLLNMSNILKNLAENDKLAMKGKSTSLIEKLVDRVCEKCDLKVVCWKREVYLTYAAFEELLEGCKGDNVYIPKEIERKCIKRSLISKNAKDIMNNFILSEIWRKRLSEGRELLSQQVLNMAETVSEIMGEVNEEISFDVEIERKINYGLRKNHANFNDVICYRTKKGRFMVKITSEACKGSQYCIKEILPIINDICGKNMCFSEEGCKIDSKTSRCAITFEETPKYHIASYVSKLNKDGEKSSGDSFIFGKQKDGTYIIMISDGMGSGEEARHESQAVVELIEKFTLAGFNKATAINTVNSIMTMKFNEEEKFSTVDLSSIDLYSGELEIMKVGAVSSFIKRKKKVVEIKSNTLPIGVLDRADVEQTNYSLENGDILVMISDGVLDYDNENVAKTQWAIEYIEETISNNPKDIAYGLVEKARKLGGGIVKDDMTAIVSRVYNVF